MSVLSFDVRLFTINLFHFIEENQKIAKTRHNVTIGELFMPDIKPSMTLQVCYAEFLLLST